MISTLPVARPPNPSLFALTARSCFTWWEILSGSLGRLTRTSFIHQNMARPDFGLGCATWTGFIATLLLGSMTLALQPSALLLAQVEKLVLTDHPQVELYEQLSPANPCS